MQELLAAPQRTDPSWQSEAGKCSAQLSLYWSQDVSDDDALRVLVAVDAAAHGGVQDAKKRQLKLSRWSAVAPPKVQLLETLAAQKQAIRLLSKLSADWVIPYIEDSIRSDTTSAKLAKEYWLWLVKATDSPQRLLGDSLVRLLPMLAARPDWHKALSREVQATIRNLGWHPPDQIAGILWQLAQVTGSQACNRQDVGKTTRGKAPSFVATVALWADAATWANPAILLATEFMSLASWLVASTRAKDRGTASLVRAWGRRTLALLLDYSERVGPSALASLGRLIPLFQSTHPDSFKRLVALAKTNEAAHRLVHSSPANIWQPSIEDRSALETVLASIFPAWDDLRNQFGDATGAFALNAMLEQAAEHVGVTRLHDARQVIPYDPFAHALLDPNGRAPLFVEILHPGLQSERPDGGKKILIQALARPSNNEPETS